MLHRRAFLGAMGAGAAATALTATAAERPFGETGVPLQGSEPLPLGPLPGGRYPDPHVESLKKPQGAFGQSGFPGFAGTMAVERIATGMRWAEGPVYFPAGRYVLFSDIPNNRIMRYCEDDRIPVISAAAGASTETDCGNKIWRLRDSDLRSG